jgi:hypothetical protein
MNAPLNIRDIIMALKSFPEDAFILIDSTNCEYGPVFVTDIHAHQGKKEPGGVNGPQREEEKGFPVFT